MEIRFRRYLGISYLGISYLGPSYLGISYLRISYLGINSKTQAKLPATTLGATLATTLGANRWHGLAGGGSVAV